MGNRVRASARGVLLGLVVFGLLTALARRSGVAIVELPRIDGAEPWSTSRATGVIAYLALSLDVLVGLGLTTRAGDRWPGRAASVDIHAWLSPLALGLTGVHAAALLADAYIGFDLIDLVVPFASSYRPVAVGAGITAAYVALLVHGSFALRGRIGTAWWRRLHVLSFIAYLLATLHGITAGTDTGAPWALTIYGIPTTLVLVLVVRRIGAAVAARRSPSPDGPARRTMAG